MKRKSLPKRASRFQSVAYTLGVCEELGWMAAKTEYRQPYHKGLRTGFGMTKDLFGFIDVLAVEPGLFGVLGLQVTSDACLTRRVKKITQECYEAATRFLAAGNRIEVWGYKRVWVENRVLWDARRRVISLVGGSLVSEPSLDLSDLKYCRKVQNESRSQDHRQTDQQKPASEPNSGQPHEATPLVSAKKQR